MKVIDKNFNVSLAYCQSVWVNKEGKVIKKTLSSGGQESMIQSALLSGLCFWEMV